MIKNPITLAIDTATEACSVALFRDEEKFLRYEEAPRRHAELLIPMIESVLAEANLKKSDLQLLSFVRGPGAFTGVRIASGVIQGLAMGLKLPVVGLSSLQLLAQACYQEYKSSQVAAAIDARMGEVYWGCFRVDDGGLMQATGPLAVAKPETISVDFDDTELVSTAGTGWLTYCDVLGKHFANLEHHYEEQRYPNLSYAWPLIVNYFTNNAVLKPEQCIPIYLRNKVAQTTAERLAAKK